MNYKLLIQYDGTDFHGWQVQDRERTVQGELESAIGSFAEETVRVTGSGRTDAGVHAEGQVANVVLEAAYIPEKLRGAINGNLCRAIRVLNVEPAPDEFHARFSAIEKTYVYRVINAAVLSPFWRRFAHHESRSLNVELMNEAAQLFVGEHDWTAFASARSDGESRVRDVVGFKVESRWDERARADLIEFRISANGFLRYMVRSIVGTLLEVGRGEKGPESVEAAIATGDRKLAGMTAPAKGLTLYRVEYPSK